MVEGSVEDLIPAMRTGLPVPAQHRAVIPLRVAPTGSYVDGRRRLRSASSMTLVVPATRHWMSKLHRR